MPKLSMPEGRMRLYQDDQNSPLIGVWEWQTPAGSPFAKLKAARDSVIDLAPRVRSKRQELKKANKLTDNGISDHLSNEVPNAARAIRKAEKVIAKAKADVAKRRNDLTLKKPDSNDLAAVLEAQEIRTWCRSMTQQERDAYFGRFDHVDPKIAEAVMTAPRELSKVADTHYELLRDRAIEAQHPGLSEELEEVEQAIDATERAVEANKNGLVEEIGRELLAEIEKRYAPAAAEVDAEMDVQSRVENSKQMAEELINLMKQLTPEDREALGRETHEEVMKDIIGRPADRKAA